MSRELLVPVGAVHERLGLAPAPTVPMPTRLATIPIPKLTIKDAGPAHGIWIGRNAVLAWMRAKSESVGGDELLEKMMDELAEATL